MKLIDRLMQVPNKGAEPATETEIEQLKKAGYTVQDMGADYGAEWEGCYRWFNDRLDTFQDSEPSYAENAAWVCARVDAENNSITL